MDGSFWVIRQDGRRFLVEPIAARDQRKHERTVDFGGCDIVEGGSVYESESVIRAENGFHGITYLPPGSSPLAFIDTL